MPFNNNNNKHLAQALYLLSLGLLTVTYSPPPHVENLPKPMLGASNFILAQGPDKGKSGTASDAVLASLFQKKKKWGVGNRSTDGYTKSALNKANVS